MKNKAYVLIVILIMVIIGVILSIYFVQQNKPQNIIESKLKINLPSTSKIIYYDNDGNYFDAKILITENNVSHLKEQLNGFFINGEVSEQYLDKVPNFENTCTWWDLKKQDIMCGYNGFVNGKSSFLKSTPSSHDVWAFISKDNNGQCYLYISY